MECSKIFASRQRHTLRLQRLHHPPPQGPRVSAPRQPFFSHFPSASTFILSSFSRLSELCRLPTRSPVYSASVHPNGNLLVWGGADNYVHVCNASTGDQTGVFLRRELCTNCNLTHFPTRSPFSIQQRSTRAILGPSTASALLQTASCMLRARRTAPSVCGRHIQAPSTACGKPTPRPTPPPQWQRPQPRCRRSLVFCSMVELQVLAAY